jgi:hypothetical protein
LVDRARGFAALSFAGFDAGFVLALRLRRSRVRLRGLTIVAISTERRDDVHSRRDSGQLPGFLPIASTFNQVMVR